MRGSDKFNNWLSITIDLWDSESFFVKDKQLLSGIFNGVLCKLSQLIFQDHKLEIIVISFLPSIIQLKWDHLSIFHIAAVSNVMWNNHKSHSLAYLNNSVYLWLSISKVRKRKI